MHKSFFLALSKVRYRLYDYNSLQWKGGGRARLVVPVSVTPVTEYLFFTYVRNTFIETSSFHDLPSSSAFPY